MRDEAVKLSVEQMVDQLLPTTGLTQSELTMLMSVVGQTQICQVVDPLMTGRLLFNKHGRFLHEFLETVLGRTGRHPRRLRR